MKPPISIFPTFPPACYSFLRAKIVPRRRNRPLLQMEIACITKRFKLFAMAAALPGVRVFLAGPQSASTTTDSDGNYTFPDLPAGSYTVSLSGFPNDVSFAQTSMAATIFGRQDSAILDFMGTRIGTVTLNAEKEGNGVVTSEDDQIDCGENCSAEYDKDSKTTLTATPADGWMFAGWSGDVSEECDGKTGDCTLVMDEDKTVTAIFVEEEKQVSLIFPDPRVCIEHGTGESKILWLFVFDQIFGNENITIVIRIYFPDESFEEVEVETLEEFQEILVELNINKFGIYDWEISEAYYTDTGDEITIDGTTDGEVNVGSEEQNSGECTME